MKAKKIFTSKLKLPDAQKFGEDFVWGVASSAFQAEGAPFSGGKSSSIWDTYVLKNYLSDRNGEIDTPNFYHRYKQDIDLIKELNFNHFRFSLSWPRIMPDGTGRINTKGTDFYHRVIDYCLENNVQPWLTLYHWDLPQTLQDKGGWKNRDILDWFAEFTYTATKQYGDKVKDWMVLNEPMSFTGLGYFMGYHAPQKKGLLNFLPAAHHAMLCQGIGGRIIREEVKNSHVGTTYSVSAIKPKAKTKRHQQAAQRLDALMNRFYIEPVLGMGYPLDKVPNLKFINRFVKDGDMEQAPFDFDFIGLQYYFRVVARYSPCPPILWAKEVPARHRNVPINTLDMEIYPDGMLKILKQFATYKNLPPIYITESGVCLDDKLENNRVKDKARINYHKAYLRKIRKAQKLGIDVRGYFNWSLNDNFEWSEGTDPRFGLIYTDYESQKRIIKDSGLWFKKYLE